MIKYLPTIIPERPGYPFTAHLFSALYPHEYTHKWIYSNFIQIGYVENRLYPERGYATFPIDMNYSWQDYHLHQYCPYIENVKVHKDMINFKYKSFQEFIEFCIDENWFVLTSLNNKYIPFSENYKKNDLSHYTFIVGINTESKTARIADFYNFRKYKQYDCPLNLLELAYQDSKGHVFDPMEDEITNFIQCYRVINAIPRYDLDINIIKTKLLDFIESKDSFGKSLECNDSLDSTYWFGIEAYDKMIEYAKTKVQAHFQSSAYLVEHKIMQRDRNCFLYKNGYLSDLQYQELLEENNNLIDMADKNLKYCIKALVKFQKKMSITEEIQKMAEFIEKIKISDIQMNEHLLSYL